MQKNIRWVIVFLLFIATGLSFLDRQVLSIAIIKIQEEFHITDVQYGMINTSFLIATLLCSPWRLAHRPIRRQTRAGAFGRGVVNSQ